MHCNCSYSPLSLTHPRPTSLFLYPANCLSTFLLNPLLLICNNPTLLEVWFPASSCLPVCDYTFKANWLPLPNSYQPPIATLLGEWLNNHHPSPSWDLFWLELSFQGSYAYNHCEFICATVLLWPEDSVLVVIHWLWLLTDFFPFV